MRKKVPKCLLSFLPWFPALAAIDHSFFLLQVTFLHTLLAEELLLVCVRCLPTLPALIHRVDHLVGLLGIGSFVHHLLGGGGRLGAGCRLFTILAGLPANILWSNANFGI